jgi:hypothetical protein
MTLATNYTIGSIVRYANGPTALMKITGVSYNHGGRGVHRYYGTQFFGGIIGAYHDNCEDVKTHELRLWEQHHKKEKLLAAARTAMRAIDDAMQNLPAKGDCANFLTMARSKIQCAIEEAAS